MTADEQRRLERAMAAATAAIQRGIEQLDSRVQAELLELLEGAARDVAKALRSAAGPDGLISAHVLPTVIAQIDLILIDLRDAQVKLIEEAVREASANGARLVESLQDAAKSGQIPKSSVSALPDATAAATDALQAVLHQLQEDGLNISDRIWRNWQALREALIPQIQRSVLAGESARAATREALVRGGKASAEDVTTIELARAGAIGDQAEEILASAAGLAYANAQRVFRTEMDRANILAARAGMYVTEGVVGTRFLLSPAHPRYDICDVHASVNLYGLGSGVYPPGASPLPAHPNTLSYEEAVFAWEVTEQDRRRDDLMGWLGGLGNEDLYGVLQSKEKVSAFRAGLLQPGELTLPWRELKGKYGQSIQAP
jgi:hypothetical protein